MTFRLSWNPSTGDVDWRVSSPIAPSSSAVFSHDRAYRYVLTRLWDQRTQAHHLAIVGLNPSTADELKDDPTIRRCIDFARSNGYGGIIMLNLFAYRATDPRKLKACDSPIGPLNDEALSAIGGAHDVLCAWGTHGSWMSRDERVVQMLRDVGAYLLCLGTTSAGSPRHPLYLPKTTALRPFA